MTPFVGALIGSMLGVFLSFTALFILAVCSAAKKGDKQ